MGRNSAIKRYDTHPEGQPATLFETPRGRLPVIMELLRSPWIVRGSDLPARDAGDGARVLDEAAEVEWDAGRGCPGAFTWRGRRYAVDAVVQAWAVERGWWTASARVSRRCFRVLARGGIYDLAYDRLADGWLLLGVVD